MAYFEGFATENVFLHQGLQELMELTSYLEALEISDQCIFNPFLARDLKFTQEQFMKFFSRWNNPLKYW